MTDTTQLPLLKPDTGALAPFVEVGLIREAEVQAAGAVSGVLPGTSEEVLLAVALGVRALQMGHVCLDLDHVADTIGSEQDDIAGLSWPDRDAWATALRASDAVAERDPQTGRDRGATTSGNIRPLVFDGRRVYLERYWRFERHVGDTLLALSGTSSGGGPPADPGPGPAAVESALDTVFGTDEPGEQDLQRMGARTALTSRLTVLAGGPGTGKTHTIARTLAAAHHLAIDAGATLDVALAAPTGKAAARMTEAVHQAVDRAGFPDELAGPLRETEASTIHRLLGYRDGMNFRHDASNPLPHDFVVIDETSMVALPLMARLLDALRPGARLLLVGDPHQLASVEAGAVLGDIVGPLARGDSPDSEGPIAHNVVVLERVHRFGEDSAIAELSHAVRSGDSDRAVEVLEDSDNSEVEWIRPGQPALDELRSLVLDSAAEVVTAAMNGDASAALERAGELKVLCGTRFGPLGSHAWRDHIEARLPGLVPGLRTERRWYVGRPVIVTANDYIARVFNGDTGVVVDRDGVPAVTMATTEGVRSLVPSQLASTDTWWSMTIHKSQGSEFDHVVVSLPEATSRVLTNELLYTGITRGKKRVTVVATEDALRAAIERPVARASGLGTRLWNR